MSSDTARIARSFLADYLWLPALAYAADQGHGPSFLGFAFALNLGSRLIPNVAVTKLGRKAEFPMMVLVIAGYSTSLLHPTQAWAFFFMAFCSGLGFLRVCVTLHIQATFAESEQFCTVCKYAGASKNLGSISAMILPILLYQQYGWRAVCLGALAAAVLYLFLSILQSLQQASVSELGVKAWLVANRQRQGLCMIKASCIDSQDSQADLIDDVSSDGAVVWIDWIIGFAFTITELQYNIGNAAIPQTLTRTFGMQVAMLHRNPVNIVLAFLSILLSWILASVASFIPEGLPIFVASILLFTLAVNMVQVLLLEYLSNVLDAQGSKKLLGLSETLGCGFAMLGGYLGDVLEVYGDAAPFMMQSAVALVAVSMVGACLGYRHMTRSKVESAYRKAVTRAGSPLAAPLLDGDVLSPSSSHPSVASERSDRSEQSEGPASAEPCSAVSVCTCSILLCATAANSSESRSGFHRVRGDANIPS